VGWVLEENGGFQRKGYLEKISNFFLKKKVFFAKEALFKKILITIPRGMEERFNFIYLI
jgi:hypothetical protein